MIFGEELRVLVSLRFWSGVIAALILSATLVFSLIMPFDALTKWVFGPVPQEDLIKKALYERSAFDDEQKKYQSCIANLTKERENTVKVVAEAREGVVKSGLESEAIRSAYSLCEQELKSVKDASQQCEIAKGQLAEELSSKNSIPENEGCLADNKDSAFPRVTGEYKIYEKKVFINSDGRFSFNVSYASNAACKFRMTFDLEDTGNITLYRGNMHSISYKDIKLKVFLVNSNNNYCEFKVF